MRYYDPSMDFGKNAQVEQMNSNSEADCDEVVKEAE